MRNRFVEVTSKLIEKDERVVTLLGEVTLWGFRHAMEKYPERILDIGILEQASISFAAGLAIAGMIPVFHSFSPFIAERAYEQLKLDFGYQKLGGNFVSMGASFDNSMLGATHHSPADVAVLRMIPGMQIVIPGTADEFETIYRSEYDNGHPTYFRLSDHANSSSHDVKFGKACIVRKGASATVVAVGPFLDTVLDALGEEDVTILYYTTLEPFDVETLRENLNGDKILLCEPYYEGVLTDAIISAMPGKSVRLEKVGMPHRFIRNYGTYDENLKHLGLTAEDVRGKYEKLMKN